MEYVEEVSTIVEIGGVITIPYLLLRCAFDSSVASSSQVSRVAQGSLLKMQYNMVEFNVPVIITYVFTTSRTASSTDDVRDEKFNYIMTLTAFCFVSIKTARIPNH